jgi:hypothetical protein
MTAFADAAVCRLEEVIDKLATWASSSQLPFQVVEDRESTYETKD